MQTPYLIVDKETTDWLRTEEGQDLIKGLNELADKIEAKTNIHPKEGKTCLSCGAPYADPMPCGH